MPVVVIHNPQSTGWKFTVYSPGNLTRSEQGESEADVIKRHCRLIAPPVFVVHHLAHDSYEVERLLRTLVRAFAFQVKAGGE
jgi:hypothetical protein